RQGRPRRGRSRSASGGQGSPPPAARWPRSPGVPRPGPGLDRASSYILLSAWSFTDDGSQNLQARKSGSPSRIRELLPPPPGDPTHGALEKAYRLPKRPTAPCFTLPATGAAPHRCQLQLHDGPGDGIAQVPITLTWGALCGPRVG